MHNMKKIIIPLSALIVIIIAIIAINQFFLLRKAHSSFDNYYAFRGCEQLIEKTNTSGTCKLSSGKEITIVQFHDRWYLDGDLPMCIVNFCF